jgi:hypothetical protein
MSTPSRLFFPLVVCLHLFACAPSASFSEVHELRPITRSFGEAAPALPPAVAALGMQVAQQTSASESVTVTAVTPQGVRVQITLRPAGPTTSTLDLQGTAEQQQALAQLATRLAESLAEQLAQHVAEPSGDELLRSLGYIATDERSEAK